MIEMIEIDYNVIRANDRDLSILVQGDLSEYVQLSDDLLTKGEDSFSIKLKLPETLNSPGKNTIWIKVTETSDEELVGTFIGVSVAIKSAINIYVPYPGQYLEVELTSKDVNIGDPLDFGLNVISRGTEEVDITPRIEIYDSQNSKVETLLFNNRIIAGQETLSLRKTLDTHDYNAGNYKAVAIIEYGGLAKSESEFKIGALSIEILNYTNIVPIGGLERFDLLIESGWNNQIDGAYAEVVFLNGSEILDSFKTSTTTLIPWEKKVITGYFDTSNFTQGIYDVNMSLFYFGKDQGKSSNMLGKVEFVQFKNVLIWYFIGGVGLLIIISLLGIKFFRKNGKKRKK